MGSHLSQSITLEDVWIEKVLYDATAKSYLRHSGHYLQNPPPGAFFAVGVGMIRDLGLLGVPTRDPQLRGLCLFGRPVAPRLPQDGTFAEVTRMVLDAGLPYGLASSVLMFGLDLACDRGVKTVIAYHDRSRHTGCIYKKAGFKRDGIKKANDGTWGNRPGREQSAEAGQTSKRRWRVELPPVLELRSGNRFSPGGNE